jgi:hypothetical protein
MAIKGKNLLPHSRHLGLAHETVPYDPAARSQFLQRFR